MWTLQFFTYSQVKRRKQRTLIHLIKPRKGQAVPHYPGLLSILEETLLFLGLLLQCGQSTACYRRRHISKDISFHNPTALCRTTLSPPDASHLHFIT